jgi:putative nucleotidyltransferase with HDIG domain
MISQKNVPDSIKVKFLAGLTSEALDTFDDSGFSSVEHLQKVSSYLMEMATSLTNFNEIMKIIGDLPDHESRHAVLTTMVSLALCEEMKVTLRAALEKVALGCLLHDVGMKYVGKDLLNKPRHTWSDEDNSAYENHTLKGVEMLRDLKEISNDVLLIVAEHHENGLGTGFPKRMRDVKISPLSRIVIVADYFSDLLFGRDNLGKTYTADQAIIYMEDILGQPFNKQVFSALKTVVNKRFLADKSRSA